MPAYAGAITEAAERIGALLVAEGAIGRAAIDFIVGRNRSGTWSAYAIEINLRKGATTHPLYTLELVTGGAYDPRSGSFRTPDGSTRHYVATDYLASPRLSMLGDGALLALAERPGLEPDGCGVVFHMLSALTDLGRMGMTVIGSSAGDAHARFEAAQNLLLSAAATVEAEVAVVA